MTNIEQKVKYKNDLKQLINKLSINHVVDEKLYSINRIKEENDLVEYDQLIQNYAELIQKNEQIISIVKKIIDKTDIEIAEIVNKTYNGIDKLKDITPTAYVIVNDELESIILNKIAAFSQYRFPGLQLNCTYSGPQNQKTSDATLKWISSMVASDPFYLAGAPDDYGNIDYLEEMISPYPEIYQKRLRLYPVHNRNLDILPQAQFGLILCWNFFNYQILDTIEIYLSKIIKLLRPGGRFIFSYNNCELIESARMFDNHQASYSTETELRKILSAVGFEIIEFQDIKTNIISYCSWSEVRRPGELNTIKRSQAQGLVGRK